MRTRTHDSGLTNWHEAEGFHFVCELERVGFVEGTACEDCEGVVRASVPGVFSLLLTAHQRCADWECNEDGVCPFVIGLSRDRLG